MSKKLLYLISSAVVLAAVGFAQADLLVNGDFEADLALVPNPGDTDASAPAGWEYDRYYGYDVDPWLMNISAVGDGSGGNVGVVFGTWNVEGAWDPAMATYPETPVEAGQYTLEVTTVSTGGTVEGWLDVQLGWFEDPADPWANYDEYVREWTDVSLFGDGVWTTLTWDFEIPADDPGLGMNWYLWLRGQSYDDYVIVGDVKLTAAEPPVTIPVDPNSDLAAANESAKAGDTIEFAAGTYYITSQILVKDGVTYKGAGTGLTIIDGNDTTRAFAAWGDRSYNEGSENPNDSGPKGWVIEGMTIQNCVADANDRYSFTGSAFDMNDVFAENDADGSGGLNPDEADADSGGIRLPGPDGEEGTEDDDLHRFEHMDTDGNGELSQEELLAQIAVTEDEFSDQSRDGGALFCDNQATGTVTNCEFLNNHTTPDGDDGGAIFIGGGSIVTITGCGLKGNNSADDGGAIFVASESNVTVTDCGLEGNYSGDDGGAVNIAGLSIATINNCTFTGNYAASPDSVEVEGLDGDGGHIKVQGASASAVTPGTTLIANRCDFLNGNASDDGGAICSAAVGTVVRLDGCWFEGNTSWDNGNVCQFANNRQHEVTVTNCVFVNNVTKADNSPDRMIETNRNSKFINCTFVGNNQEDQDIIYNNANTQDTDGDGVDDEMADVTQVVNCIFLNNVVGNGDDVLGSRNNDFSIAATNCLFFGNTLQNGNDADNTQRPAEESGSIMADPLLDAEYVPGEGSPAIDAGVDPATVGVTLLNDYNGVVRPQGSAYDIGAIEVVVAPPAE